MSEINFFTAVSYNSGSTLVEKVDDYFNLGGKKAIVIEGRTSNGQEKVILSPSESSLLARIAKLLSYFTIVMPLFMLVAKAILRSQHNFKVIDIRKELEEGITISSETTRKIQELMPKILQGKEDDQIQWSMTKRTRVFKLAQHPDLVFKIANVRNENILYRFENMVDAKQTCLVHQLGLLIIPHAKTFTVNADGNEYTFIAEEYLEFNPRESSQEEFYHKYSRELNETAHQLATFVAKSGFNDVAWRNIPILTEAQGYQGPRRVGLIDLEHMWNKSTGFLGEQYYCGNRSRGLIACVSEEQIDIVIAEACKNGIITEAEAVEAKKKRLKEIESDKSLQDYFQRNRIISGKELIVLNTNEDPWRNYHALGFRSKNIEVQKHVWLYRIIQALVDKGHLFNFEYNCYGYCIQA